MTDLIPYQSIVQCFITNGYGDNESYDSILLNDEGSHNSISLKNTNTNVNEAIDSLQTAINEFCSVYSETSTQSSDCFISREHYENTLFYILLTSSSLFICILFLFVRLCCCRR